MKCHDCEGEAMDGGLICFDCVAVTQEAAARKFGKYAKEVIEWAVYTPDMPPPDYPTDGDW